MASPADTLRVIDFGCVSPLRSQTLWHAVAHGVSAGEPPTLSFVRPSAPYACVGFHRGLDEVDLDACRRNGLPVYRRMVGGGPVYLDGDQLFFQIAVPAGRVSPRRDRAIRFLLEPAVEAFHAAGVPADLDDNLEIVVGDRKVCGHGAAQIGEAVIVVGNLIERFDHEAAAGVLRAPSDRARVTLLSLMRRYVSATPADPGRFQTAASAAYARALNLMARPGAMGEVERAALDDLDRRFEDPQWRAGPRRPAKDVWQAKVRAGVSVFCAGHAGAEVVAGVVGGRLREVHVADVDLNGSAAKVARALDGCQLDEVGATLAPFGAPGRRLVEALAKVDRRTI